MSATPSHAHGAAASAPRGATSHPSTESARLPALFGPRGELGALPPATRPPNVCAMPSPPRGCPRRRVRPTPRRPTPTRCGKRTGWAALGFADWHAAPDSQPHWRPGWAALGFADSHAALDSQIPVANRRGAFANPPTQPIWFRGLVGRRAPPRARTPRQPPRRFAVPPSQPSPLAAGFEGGEGGGCWALRALAGPSATSP